jgi:hypothetical protein
MFLNGEFNATGHGVIPKLRSQRQEDHKVSLIDCLKNKLGHSSSSKETLGSVPSTQKKQKDPQKFNVRFFFFLT